MVFFYVLLLLRGSFANLYLFASYCRDCKLCSADRGWCPTYWRYCQERDLKAKKRKHHDEPERSDNHLKRNIKIKKNP